MSYNVEVNDVDSVTKKVSISIPPDTFSKEFDTVISGLVKTSKVNGFRQGKAPRHLVERMHGERVKFEVANRLISSSLFTVIKERSIDMVGDPELDVPEIVPGKELSFTAQISVYPKPEIKDYKGVEIEVKKREVQAADVDDTIKKLQEQRATTKKIELRNEIKKGDVIDGMLSVQLEGETESSRPEPLHVQVGEGVLPAELDEGLIGLAVGDKRVIQGKVPESHRDEALRGKPAVYTVTLNGISEKILPEVTDDFVASLGREAKTVLALRVEIEKQLEDEAKKGQEGDIQVAALDALIEKNPFQVPQPLVDNEIRSLLVRLGMVNPQKVDVSAINVTRFREGLGEVAAKRVKGSVVVDRVVEAEKLMATPEDFEKWMAKFSEENRLGLEDVKKYFGSKERVAQQMVELSRERGLEFIRENAKVKFTS